MGSIKLSLLATLSAMFYATRVPNPLYKRVAILKTVISNILVFICAFFSFSSSSGDLGSGFLKGFSASF